MHYKILFSYYLYPLKNHASTVHAVELLENVTCSKLFGFLNFKMCCDFELKLHTNSLCVKKSLKFFLKV